MWLAARRLLESPAFGSACRYNIVVLSGHI
jgi:hypothetical protein